MKVYAIRHGLTELNKKKILNGQIDEPLSPEGIKQAEEAINKIPKTIQFIYTSPMLRTRQTTEIINSKLLRPINIENSLTEIHMGSVAGKSWDSFKSGLEMKKRHRAIQFNYQSEGGELAADVKKRVLRFLKEIYGKHEDYEALIVTHGGIIRVLHFLETGEELLNDIEHISPCVFDLKKILKRIKS